MLILSLSIMGILTGCGNKKGAKDNGNKKDSPSPVESIDDNEEDGKNEPTPTPIEPNEDNTGNVFVPIENLIDKEDYDYKDYIKLGKYKGIEVKVEKLVVTEKDIDAVIQMDLSDNAVVPVDVTNRPVRFGDTVVMDFVGYHNGEPFSGGTAEAYELTIGSNLLIDGFEEQLVGAEINKEIDVRVVFPENYGNTTLSGQPAVFKVTVKGIRYFELTEDIIKNIMGFDSEEAYRNSIRQELEARNSYITDRQKENDVYMAVIRGSEITPPDNLIEFYESDIRTLYSNIAASYGVELDVFFSSSGSSLEEFEREAKSYANSMAIRELIIKAICTIEGIELTEEDFEKGVVKYTEQYGYESNEAFLEEADVDVLKDDLLFEKVIDFLVAESIEI